MIYCLMIIHFINFHIYFNAIYCSKLSLKIKLCLTVCIQIMDGMRIVAERIIHTSTVRKKLALQW